MTQQAVEKSKAKIKDFQSVMHWAMEKYYLNQQQGTIDCKGHELDGKTIVCETKTKRNGELGIGKVTQYWAIEDDKKTFASIKELQKYYDL